MLKEEMYLAAAGTLPIPLYNPVTVRLLLNTATGILEMTSQAISTLTS
jgi:hypothetical protein